MEMLPRPGTYGTHWGVPGGAIDLGESVAQAAVRETREESGIDCEITGVVGIYSDPKHLHTGLGPEPHARGLPRGVADRQVRGLAAESDHVAASVERACGTSAASARSRRPAWR